MKTVKSLSLLAIAGFLLDSCSQNTDFSFPYEALPAIEKTGGKNKRLIKNYQAIYDTACQNQPVELFRQALKLILSNPHGRDILKKMKNPIEIKIKPMHSFWGGGYVHFVQIIFLNENQMTSSQELMKHLLHEMLHHIQYERGTASYANNLSPEQTFLVDKLHEAEAASWDEVVMAGYKYLDGNGSKTNCGLKKFMLSNQQFSPTSVEHMLRQALVQTNGNREQAEKIVVGKRIAQYMAEKPANNYISNWRSIYDVDCAHRLYELYRYKKPHAINPENTEKVNQILDFFVQTYGVKKSQINQAYIQKTKRSYYELVMKKIQQKNPITNQELKQLNINIYN